MRKAIRIIEADKVEILTLQDNYIEITALDGNEVVSRAVALKEGQIRNSILAEHGFSALVRITAQGRTRSILFDFGFSEEGAAYNARALGADLGDVEAIALSHGHSDHLGGFDRLIQMIGKKDIELIVHPDVFKRSRYLKFSEELKVYFPEFTRETAGKTGVKIVESRTPRPLLDGAALFLGEIPRQTEFEKGMPHAFFLADGVEKKDLIEDDTSLVMNLRGKGLIVLSGCAHAGIVNTVAYAREVTGVDRVHVIMGGFHLSGPAFEPIIGRTTEELKKFNPAYVVPTHCTGRKAVMQMEREMPKQFILNMSGTKLTFAA